MPGFETTVDLSEAGKQIYLLEKRLANIGWSRSGGLEAISGVAAQANLSRPQSPVARERIFPPTRLSGPEWEYR